MQRSSHPAPVPASAADGAMAARPRLFDEMRARMRRLGLSLRTEEAYVGWARPRRHSAIGRACRHRRRVRIAAWSPPPGKAAGLGCRYRRRDQGNSLIRVGSFRRPQSDLPG